MAYVWILIRLVCFFQLLCKNTKKSMEHLSFEMFYISWDTCQCLWIQANVRQSVTYGYFYRFIFVGYFMFYAFEIKMMIVWYCNVIAYQSISCITFVSWYIMPNSWLCLWKKNLTGLVGIFDQISLDISLHSCKDESCTVMGWIDNWYMHVMRTVIANWILIPAQSP